LCDVVKGIEVVVESVRILDAFSPHIRGDGRVPEDSGPSVWNRSTALGKSFWAAYSISNLLAYR